MSVSEIYKQFVENINVYQKKTMMNEKLLSYT